MYIHGTFRLRTVSDASTPYLQLIGTLLQCIPAFSATVTAVSSRHLPPWAARRLQSPGYRMSGTDRFEYM